MNTLIKTIKCTVALVAILHVGNTYSSTTREKMSEGMTVYDAVIDRNLAMVERLIEMGADVNSAILKKNVGSTRTGFTPLEHAVGINNAPIVKALIGAGATLPSDLIQAAAQQSSPEVITALLNGGISVNELDTEFKRTALHWAASTNNYKIVPLLLQRGAYTYLKDYKGETPLQIAQRKGSTEVVRLLEQYEKTGKIPAPIAMAPKELEEKVFAININAMMLADDYARTPIAQKTTLEPERQKLLRDISKIEGQVRIFSSLARKFER